LRLGTNGLTGEGGVLLIRILIVDDNSTVRQYLRAILEQQTDWQVCGEARTGEEALRGVEVSAPHIVLLDFRLPDLNGLDVAREIGREHAEIPILMVTVYLSAQLAAEAKAAGVRGVCAKSDIGSIVEAVEALLKNGTYFPAPLRQDSIAM
jgi:two-component system, NarL family, invasion response regulator UvrY